MKATVENIMNKGFMDLGLDSREMLRMRNVLGQKTGKELTTMILFDHPNVQSLVKHLTEPETLPEPEYDEDPNDPDKGLMIKLETLLEMQEQMVEGLISIQPELEAKVRVAWPDKIAYITSIEDDTVRLQTPLFYERGITDVQRGRVEVSKTITRWFYKSEKLRQNLDRLNTLAQISYEGPWRRIFLPACGRITAAIGTTTGIEELQRSRSSLAIFRRWWCSDEGNQKFR